MSRAIDKFLGLYEVIINQYNPFIEHVTPPQVIPPQISQPAHPVVAPPPAQVAPQVVTASQPPITPDALDINGVIQKVRDATLEQDFRALMPAVIAWVEKNTQDAVLLEQLKSAHAQSDVVKLLIKKSLKLNMNS
jgi:hypothetical protein